MNLCVPDSRKSCAACCGLYNVFDATRPALQEKLQTHTKIFRRTARSTGALFAFEEKIRGFQADSPVDEAIHVCEFTGFVDEDSRVPGCLLHPTAPGNGGVDLRGLCHYGSMACKAFFCPAWEGIELRQRMIVVRLVEDWHLYGLVATDLDFLGALFRLVEGRLRRRLTSDFLDRNQNARRIFRQMLQWKDDWPLRGSSRLRRSRYYCKPSDESNSRDRQEIGDCLLGCIRFTFGLSDTNGSDAHLVEETLEHLVEACSPSPR